MTKQISLLALLLSVSLSFGCDDNPSDGDGDADADSDGDGDGDADSDADSDADADDELEALEIGEVVDLPAVAGEDAFELAFATPEGTERYLAIISSDAWERRGPVSYSIELMNSESLVREPLEAAPEDTEFHSPRVERPSPAHLSNLAQILSGLRDGSARRVLRAPDPPPTEGEVRTFSVLGDGRVAEIEAEAVFVSPSVAFWLDISSDPPAEISTEDLEEIATQYDEIILPREHIFFGEESDINDDGNIFVVMSEVVHENDGPVAFFYGCDLLEPGAPGCRYSNEAEVLYLTPPNAIEPPYNTPRAILETMAHETNHMIFMNTKYMNHDSVGDVENMYILEGLAALAQDLSGYQAGNLYVSWFGLQDILDFSAADVLEDDGVYLPSRDGGLRGGAYLLMRYLYDQAGGDEALGDGTFDDLGGIEFIYGLHNSPTPGLAGIEEALSLSLSEVVTDFYTTLAVTNRGEDHGPICGEARFNYLPTMEDPITGRQRGFDAYAPLHGGAMNGPASVRLFAADGEMRPTGVEYVEVEASDTESLTLRVAGPAEGMLRARLARIE